MVHNQLIYAMVLSILAIQCGTSRQQTSAKMVIQLEKTGCRGYCPVYTMSIYSDRSVQFTGVAYTNATDQKANIRKEDYDALIEAFEKENFSAFDTSYVKPVADIPFTYLSYRIGGNLKKVATRGSYPEGFNHLVQMTEQIARNFGWLNQLDDKETTKEVIVELVAGTEPSELIESIDDHPLEFIKKITPNQPYYLFRVETEQSENFLEILRQNSLVKSAQWNHKLKRRSE